MKLCLDDLSCDSVYILYIFLELMCRKNFLCGIFFLFTLDVLNTHQSPVIMGENGDNSVNNVVSAVNRTIKPLYMKNSDIQLSNQARITDYDIMTNVTKQIGDELHCLQLDRNLWRLYLKSKEARTKLLTEGLNLSSVTVSLYDTNPYSAEITHPTQKTLKVSICGLPLSVDDWSKKGIKVDSDWSKNCRVRGAVIKNVLCFPIG